MLKITIGVKGLSEDSGRDDGIERRFGSGVTGSSKDLGRDDGIKETLILRAFTLVQRLYCLLNLAPRLSILTRKGAGKRVLRLYLCVLVT